jgi:hypothetical protein
MEKGKRGENDLGKFVPNIVGTHQRKLFFNNFFQVHEYVGHESEVHLLLPFAHHLLSVDRNNSLKIWEIDSTGKKNKAVLHKKGSYYRLL